MSGVGCFCDYRCHDLNDCCAAVNSTLSPLSSEGDAVPSVCLSIENVFLEDMILPSGDYVSAITHCPSEKPISEEVKLGCEEADLMLVASREENLFQWLRTHARSVVPVVSFRNRRLYGNVFCAICNGQSQDQVHFSPIHLGCRKEGNTTECLVSVKLPASLSRPCIPQRSRLLSPKVSFLSMDDLFIIPDEYLNSQYITLPLNFGKDDKNSNSTNRNKTQISSASSNPVYDTDNRNAVYTWVQLALLIFSIVGLTLMLVVYGLTAKLRRSLAGILTMGLGIALLVMEATFLMVAFAVSHVENRGFCVFMVALLLYSLLFATILPLCLVLPATTINEHAFNLLSSAYFNLSSVSQPSTFDEAKTEDEFASFNITTAEVLGESLAAVYPGFCPDGARSWFTNLGGLIVWFLVPAGTMITFNSLALLVVCVQICHLSKEAQLHSSPQNEQERKRRKKSKNLAGICAKLAIILGASWFVQLFAGWWSQLFVMRRILGLVNSAQGGVIAVSMLASVKARRALANVLPECCRVLVGHNSSTQQSTSREKEKSTSTTSKTSTSVLLPRRNRQQIQSIGDSGG
ncbi:hypothetical protein EGR_01296 [Echinococcus granulosus]|uniref:G-protein coupled receptors family 2 profile 2 domain-containing protein n=1 Tax=Echinococcus granulosus TaxID=6210 RepID=W6UR26_ECHGR|nr:hypothetical protein EGR_01296 [Echinococcus granulosus]EUB63673.1 hypothetical protein EGR_01296 [Echinococcus granulosus]